MESVKKDDKIRKVQVVKFEVNSQELKEINTNTKLEHDRIKGVFFRIERETTALAGATARVWIDDTEVLPADTEIALLHHSDDMSIEDVAFPIDEKAKNSNIKIVYKDNSELAENESYIVRMYLLAIEEKKNK